MPNLDNMLMSIQHIKTFIEVAERALMSEGTRGYAKCTLCELAIDGIREEFPHLNEALSAAKAENKAPAGYEEYRAHLDQSAGL